LLSSLASRESRQDLSGLKNAAQFAIDLPPSIFPADALSRAPPMVLQYSVDFDSASPVSQIDAADLLRTPAVP
jgi:hypothetical protein